MFDQKIVSCTFIILLCKCLLELERRCCWPAWQRKVPFVLIWSSWQVMIAIRRGWRVNEDRFPKRAQKAQASRGVSGHVPPGSVDFNSLKSPFLGFWVILKILADKTVETGIDPRLAMPAFWEHVTRWCSVSFGLTCGNGLYAVKAGIAVAA